MENRYTSNRLYVSEKEQETIKNFRIIIGGVGIGSIVAECALRFGFEHITIIDGDKVEESHLNRQNYTSSDIGRPKAECLAKRLSDINPKAHIKFRNEFFTKENANDILENQDVAVEAMDDNDESAFVFAQQCKERNIPVLHPYNFGWAGFLTIADPSRHSLSELSDIPSRFDLKVADYVTGYSAFWQNPQPWLEQILNQYRAEKTLFRCLNSPSPRGLRLVFAPMPFSILPRAGPLNISRNSIFPHCWISSRWHSLKVASMNRTTTYNVDGYYTTP